MGIKIDKNIPMPASLGSTKWPFGNMEVGDSFEVPTKSIQQIISAMSWYGKRNKMKFSRRKNRVWRIK